MKKQENAKKDVPDPGQGEKRPVFRIEVAKPLCALRYSRFCSFWGQKPAFLSVFFSRDAELLASGRAAHRILLLFSLRGSKLSKKGVVILLLLLTSARRKRRHRPCGRSTQSRGLSRISTWQRFPAAGVLVLRTSQRAAPPAPRSQRQEFCHQPLVFISHGLHVGVCLPLHAAPSRCGRAQCPRWRGLP